MQNSYSDYIVVIYSDSAQMAVSVEKGEGATEPWHKGNRSACYLGFGASFTVTGQSNVFSHCRLWAICMPVTPHW